MRYDLTPAMVTIIKKTKITSVDKEQKRELLYNFHSENWCICYEKQCEVSSKN